MSDDVLSLLEFVWAAWMGRAIGQDIFEVLRGLASLTLSRMSEWMGEPIPRPNEAAPPRTPVVTVDEAYDKKAGEFSGGPSRGLPTLAMPKPHELESHENMRRLYATDSTDPESGGDLGDVVVLG